MDGREKVGRDWGGLGIYISSGGLGLLEEGSWVGI